MVNKISGLFILFSMIACQPEQKEMQLVEDHEPKSLLLPEHQDTTSIYQPLPDSVFKGISYNNPQKFKGKTYNRITFTHLAKVTRISVPFEEYALMEVLEVSEEVQSLHDQEIIIKGFLLPAIHTANVYVLSRHPYSNCFFCNKAGVESIMELHLSNPPKHEMKVDQIVIVKGKLKIYDRDPEHLPYTLENASIIGQL